MKKLLLAFLCIAVVMGCMPTMVFAGSLEPPKPDVLKVSMGTTLNKLTPLAAEGDAPLDGSQTYRLSANPKISLGEDNEYLYLQVEKIEAYKDATENEMMISYQIGNHVFAIEPTAIDENIVKIPLSQLCIQDHDEYDSINIEVKSGGINYSYRGHLTDIFSGTSNPHNIFDLGKYVGYYTSDDNHAISVFRGADGKVKGRVVDEVDYDGKTVAENLSLELLQNEEGTIVSEKLSCTGPTNTAKLEVTGNSLRFIEDYNYYKAFGHSKPGKITKGTVYTKATASVVNNVNTNKSYPSLEQAMAEARSGDKIQLLEDMVINRSVNVGTDITLNLNGKTITTAEDLVRPFYMSEQGRLTVGNTGGSGGIMINVKPTNAQKALNYAVDYTTLNFAPGNYEKLEIRNRTIDKVIDDKEKGRYRRSLKHVSFVGQPDAKLKNITVEPGHNATDKKMVNYVTGEDIVVDEANGYIGRIDLSDIIFDGLYFVNSENKPGIDLAYWGNEPGGASYGTVDNLEIKNCHFDLSNSESNAAAIKIVEQGYQTFGRIRIQDNIVDRAFQAIYLAGCGDHTDVSVIGNVFKNTVHNAVAMQSTIDLDQNTQQVIHDSRIRGKITVESNIIENASDRAFRLGQVLASADIKINNNIILNSGDADGELIKDVSIADGAKIDLEHNYWQLKETVTLDMAIAGSLQTPIATSVISGTFPQDVSQYVAEGYECVSDGTGKYVVKEIYKPVIVPPAKPDVTTDDTGETTTTKTEAQTTTSGNETTAVITDQTAKKLVEQAIEKKADEVAIEVPKGSGSVIKAELPAETIKEIAEKTDASLTIKTASAEVSFDNEALAAISKDAEGDKVTVIAEVVEEPTEAQKKIIGEDSVLLDLKVVHTNGLVTDFGEGKATIAIPIPQQLLGKEIKAVYLADDGTYVTLSGKEVAKEGKSYYVFETGHFSSYALVDTETVGQYFARIKKGVKGTTIKASSVAKKGSITVKWKKSGGFKVDHYQVFRSTKKNSGYGTKAFYTTKTGTQKSYKNTKQLKKGTRYYYKIRGVRTLDGQKIYTKWSNKAIRVAK